MGGESVGSPRGGRYGPFQKRNTPNDAFFLTTPISEKVNIACSTTYGGFLGRKREGLYRSVYDFLSQRGVALI